MVTFDTLRVRTGAAEWAADGRWATLPGFDVARLEKADELIVFSAHSDDETIGVGGLIAAAGDHGIPVRVVVATGDDDRRPAELREALRRLAPAARVETWGFPDGGLKHHATDRKSVV